MVCGIFEGELVTSEREQPSPQLLLRKVDHPIFPQVPARGNNEVDLGSVVDEIEGSDPEAPDAVDQQLVELAAELRLHEGHPLLLYCLHAHWHLHFPQKVQLLHFKSVEVFVFGPLVEGGHLSDHVRTDESGAAVEVGPHGEVERPVYRPRLIERVVGLVFASGRGLQQSPIGEVIDVLEVKRFGSLILLVAFLHLGKQTLGTGHHHQPVCYFFGQFQLQPFHLQQPLFQPLALARFQVLVLRRNCGVFDFAVHACLGVQ